MSRSAGYRRVIRALRLQGERQSFLPRRETHECALDRLCLISQERGGPAEPLEPVE